MLTLRGADRATAWIREWCARHPDHEVLPSAAARHAAEAVPLTHVADAGGLASLATAGRLRPAPNRTVVYFFAGPSRRRPRKSVAAIVMLAAGVEKSAAVHGVEASQYDSGGARAYGGMTKRQQKAARERLTMQGTSFRQYLGVLLDCGFEVPARYLDETPGPRFEVNSRREVDAAALASALSKQDNSSCWTVEVRVGPGPDELALDRAALRRQLVAIVVFGSEHEPELTKLQGLIPGAPVYDEEDAIAIVDVDGLAAKLRRKDLRHIAARDWSAERCRQLMEAS